MRLCPPSIYGVKPQSHYTFFLMYSVQHLPSNGVRMDGFLKPNPRQTYNWTRWLWSSAVRLHNNTTYCHTDTLTLAPPSNFPHKFPQTKVFHPRTRYHPISQNARHIWLASWLAMLAMLAMPAWAWLPHHSTNRRMWRNVQGNPNPKDHCCDSVHRMAWTFFARLALGSGRTASARVSVRIWLLDGMVARQPNGII